MEVILRFIHQCLLSEMKDKGPPMFVSISSPKDFVFFVSIDYQG